MSDTTEHDGFGLRASYHGSLDPNIHAGVVDESGWTVWLPHKCDEWDIQGGAWRSSEARVPLYVAMRSLSAFIAEAMALLEDLVKADAVPVADVVLGKDPT